MTEKDEQQLPDNDDKETEYEPSDPGLISSVDKLLESHVALSSFTAEQIKEIKDLENQCNETFKLISEFMLFLRLNYFISGDPENLIYRRKIFNDLRADLSPYYKEKDILQFEERKNLYISTLNKLKKILGEIEEWRRDNLSSDS